MVLVCDPAWPLINSVDATRTATTTTGPSRNRCTFVSVSVLDRVLVFRPLLAHLRMAPTRQERANKQRQQHAHHECSKTNKKSLVLGQRAGGRELHDRAFRPFEPTGKDVLAARQRQLEYQVDRFCCPEPGRRQFEDPVVFGERFHLLLVGGHGDLCVLDGLSGTKVVQEYGQALLAGENANQLIVRRDGHHARGHRQVQWRRLVVIMPLVTDDRA